MGLLDFFKRKRKSTTPHIKTGHPNISTVDDFLMIKAIDFYGPFSSSPNGKYMVGLDDSDYRGTRRGGHRESGDGRCVLVEDESLLYQVDMERPWTAAVSDNGIVALYDIGFDGKGPDSFYVLDLEGNTIIDHQAQARDPVCGLSLAGDLAWLHTGFQQCLVFSVDPSRFLFEIEVFYPPQHIEKKGETFEVAYKGINRIYDTDGTLLNYREIAESEVGWVIENGNQYELERKANELLKAIEVGTLGTDAKNSVRLLLESAAKKAPQSPHKAKFHRKLGELAESLNDKVEALKQYTLAIEYDPKVGCKRALAKLEKELG
ncbi:tetratricopeptide repeat protein [delta proteobacterium NaphS2]|nr:tetratricopeptide repeat protein [delta proteobacterium NaphS2]